MSTPDPRFGITIPILADPADITGVRNALLGAIALMMGVAGGTFAARPAFGTFGRVYRQTDTGGGFPAGTFTFDTGAAWQVINPITALGVTGATAAAGNDPRLLAGEQGTKAPVRAVHTANVLINNPGIMTYGGIVCVQGDRILLTGQPSPAENGIYIVGVSGAQPLARSADMAAGSIIAGGCTVAVSESSVAANVDSVWMATTNDTSIVVGTDACAWSIAGGVNAGVSAANANTWAQKQTFSVAPRQAVNAITATATIAATAGKLNTFSGSSAQTITLPAAVVGDELSILNIDATDAVTVQRAGSDTVNGGASVSIPAGIRVEFSCVAAGVWIANGLTIPDLSVTGAKKGTTTIAQMTAPNTAVVNGDGFKIMTAAGTAGAVTEPTTGIDATAATSRLTVRRTGWYRLAMEPGLSGSAPASGLSEVGHAVNGVAVSSGGSTGFQPLTMMNQAAGAGNMGLPHGNRLLSLTAGDYVQMVLRNYSATSMTMRVYFTLEYLGT